VLDESAAWRIVYRLDADAVVIVAVFSKKTATTPSQVLENCRRRLRAYDASSAWRKPEGDRTMTTTGKTGARMTAAKRKRLEAAGWTVGSVTEFLGLSAEEQAIIEMRLALSAVLRGRRRALGLSQFALAKRLGSSQSRVAKMEAADPSVSLDLLLRALLSTGVTRRILGRAIAA
jgi:hypothetical protein